MTLKTEVHNLVQKLNDLVANEGDWDPDAVLAAVDASIALQDLLDLLGGVDLVERDASGLLH